MQPSGTNQRPRFIVALAQRDRPIRPRYDKIDGHQGRRADNRREIAVAEKMGVIRRIRHGLF